MTMRGVAKNSWGIAAVRAVSSPWTRTDSLCSDISFSCAGDLGQMVSRPMPRRAAISSQSSSKVSPKTAAMPVLRKLRCERCPISCLTLEWNWP